MNNPSPDPTVAAMTMDMLGNVLSRADNPGRLGDYLTEVNVTSPTGVQEINALNGVRLDLTLAPHTQPSARCSCLDVLVGQARDEESLRTLQQLASVPADKRDRPVSPLVIRSINLVDVQENHPRHLELRGHTSSPPPASAKSADGAAGQP